MLLQNKSNDTGRQAERWFENALPTNWVLQKPSEDIGIDGVVVILEKGELNCTEFKVQIKGSANFSNSKSITLYSIKKSTIYYWCQSLLPVLLVAYDTTTKTGYYYWFDVDMYERQIRNQINEKEHINISFPKKSRFDFDCWSDIKKELIRQKNAFHNAVVHKEFNLKYARKIATLTAFIKDRELLIKDETNFQDKEQIYFMIHHEWICYVRFYNIMCEIQDELNNKSPLWHRISELQKTFMSNCEKAFPNFEQCINLEKLPERLYFCSNIIRVRKKIQWHMLILLKELL